MQLTKPLKWGYLIEGNNLLPKSPFFRAVFKKFSAVATAKDPPISFALLHTYIESIRWFHTPKNLRLRKTETSKEIVILGPLSFVHQQVWWQFSLVGLLGGSNGWNVTAVGWQDLRCRSQVRAFNDFACFPAQKGTCWGFQGPLNLQTHPYLSKQNRINKSLVVALVIGFLLCLCTFVNGFQFKVPLGFESNSRCIYEVLWLKAKTSIHDFLARCVRLEGK